MTGGLSGRSLAYVGVVVLAGTALAGLAFRQPIDWLLVALFAALLVVSDAAPAILRQSDSGAVSVSVGFPIRMAAILLIGPWGTILASLVGLFAYIRGGRAVVKRVFNVAQLNVAIWLAGIVYTALGGRVGPVTMDSFPGTIVPFAVAALVYYLANAFLVTFVVVLTGGVRARHVLKTALMPVAPTYLGYGPVGLLLAILWTQVGVVAAVVAVGPVFLARWASAQLVAERESQESALRAFARAVETKDRYTRGHSERVSRLCELMGRRARLPDERVALLRYAGMLHDVGKIRVPTSILQKTGPLTRDEYAAIQLHPVYGQAMMRDVAFLDDVLPGILHHHERYDGRGYPMGLAGQDIPEFARMITVADAFDSMTSTRSYRRATGVDAALAELRKNKGVQFDPAMVDLFDAVIGEHGWEPTPAPEEPVAETGTVATFDHDDLLNPVPVQDDQGPQAPPVPPAPDRSGGP